MGGSKQEQTEAFCFLFSLSQLHFFFFFFHVVPVFLIELREGENYTFNYMVGVEGGSGRGERWGMWTPRALSHSALHLNKKAKT